MAVICVGCYGGISISKNWIQATPPVARDRQISHIDDANWANVSNFAKALASLAKGGARGLTFPAWGSARAYPASAALRGDFQRRWWHLEDDTWEALRRRLESRRGSPPPLEESTWWQRSALTTAPSRGTCQSSELEWRWPVKQVSLLAFPPALIRNYSQVSIQTRWSSFIKLVAES
jgi:hypothetical protein